MREREPVGKLTTGWKVPTCTGEEEDVCGTIGMGEKPLVRRPGIGRSRRRH